MIYNIILFLYMNYYIKITHFFQDMKLNREFEEHSNKNKITEEISREEQSQISEEGIKLYCYSYYLFFII